MLGYSSAMRSSRARRLRDLALGLAAICWALGLAVVAIYMILMMILTPGAVRACEESGGQIVWDIDREGRTASAIGKCVWAVP